MTDNKILKTGTTCVGIVYKDGIMLAADKRTTFSGSIVANAKSLKIRQVADHVAITTSGNVSDIQLYAKIIRSQLKLEELRRGKTLSSKETVNMLANLFYNSIRRMTPIPAIVGMLLAVHSRGEAHLYNVLPDGAFMEQEDYFADGSGMLFAIGVLDAEWKSNMNFEDAKALAIKAVSSAIQRDTASGGGIDIATVTKEGFEKVHTQLVENKLK